MLTIVTIGKNVMTIDNNAFSGCINLENIAILNNVKNLGVGVFRDCKKLTSVTLPNSLQD